MQIQIMLEVNLPQSDSALTASASADGNSANYYKVGGSLEFQHPTYIVRQADHELYQRLQNGDFCYVLNSRQMGKSSLRVQMMNRLQQQGYKCAAIDMMRICSDVTPAEWYGGLVSELIRGFWLTAKISFSGWFHCCAIRSGRITAFIKPCLTWIGLSKRWRAAQRHFPWGNLDGVGSSLYCFLAQFYCC